MFYKTLRLLAFFLFLFPTFSKALDLTGVATTDFPTSFCTEDPDGKSVGVPGALGSETISGFDLEQLCVYYETETDTLYVGFVTFDDEDGNPIIFGDTDANGNAGSTSAELASLEGEDVADLGNGEYVSFLIDFDNDGEAEIVAGVTSSGDINDFKVAIADNTASEIFIDEFYGSIVSADSDVFANPSSARPHFEFYITNFSTLPGASSLNLDNPDEEISFFIFAGSTEDAGIGDETVDLQNVPLALLLDDDGDFVSNLEDNDDDNDGIPDITEDLNDGFDTDGDGDWDATEADASGLDLDGDGDVDENDITLPDENSDGQPNSQDKDADGDNIADMDEANTATFDENGNGEIDPDEFSEIDTGNNYPGGDNSGALDNQEVPDTDNDSDPDYLDTDTDNDNISDEDEAGDTDLATPPVDTDGDGTPDYRDPDSENDGRTDVDEAGDDDLSTPPVDTDGDGLPDYLDPDSDNDGFEDGEEVENGTNPAIIDSPGIQVQGGGCSFNNSETKAPLIVIIMGVISFIIISMRKKEKDGGKVAKNANNTILTLLIVLSSFVITEAKAININKFEPNFDSKGLFTLLTSDSLEKRSYSLGASLDYANDPLEVAIQTTGNKLRDLVDYQVAITLVAAYGVTDNLEVGISLPFYPAVKSQPLAGGSTSTDGSLGDIGIAAKFRLWSWDNNNLAMGFALSPFITLPTGDEDTYTGNESITGGLKAIYDLKLGQNKFVANLGLRFREEEEFNNLTIGQELTYGLGYTRPVSESMDLHVLTELNGSASFNEFLSQSNHNPIEWLFGVKKGFLESRVSVSVGGSVGLDPGYGVPDYRVFTNLSYTSLPFAKKEPKVKTESESETIERRYSYNSYVRLEGGRIVILQPINFETAKWVILPESIPVVKAVADLMKNQPYIRHVVVKGHTDFRGSDAYNMNLSKNRAQAVVEKLLSYGVANDRLTSEGWGETQPIATNKTVEGMAKNRRVEFHIVEVQEVNPSKEVREEKEEVKKTKTKTKGKKK